MLDHVTIGVTDAERSKQFYDRALRPLGITRLYAEGEAAAGYGVRPKAFFWIGLKADPQTGAHVAFTAPNRATVDRFHEEAIAAAVRTTDRPAYVRTIMPITTEPLCLTPTATISKRSVT
jgi:catechol 2,3-dioxygenase-like lactoylglutathione lyase family enzyme